MNAPRLEKLKNKKQTSKQKYPHQETNQFKKSLTEAWTSWGKIVEMAIFQASTAPFPRIQGNVNARERKRTCDKQYSFHVELWNAVLSFPGLLLPSLALQCTFPIDSDTHAQEAHFPTMLVLNALPSIVHTLPVSLLTLMQGMEFNCLA